jgi:ABC-type uncharacterized transport system auxiliary subunit
MKTFLRITLLLFVIFALIGCGRSSAKYSVRDYYLLDVSRQQPPREMKFDGVLTVSKFDIAEGFNNNSLMYRNKQGKIETDYYRRFLSGKGVMISSLTTNWLADSGLFRVVASTGSGLRGNYRLSGLVEQMYADMELEEQARAVLRVKVFLVDGSSMPIFWKQYTVHSPISEPTAAAVVEATNHGIRSFLTQLEEDIAQEPL